MPVLAGCAVSKSGMEDLLAKLGVLNGGNFSPLRLDHRISPARNIYGVWAGFRPCTSGKFRTQKQVDHAAKGKQVQKTGRKTLSLLPANKQERIHKP